MARALYISTLLFSLISIINCLTFTLSAGNKKCLREEVHKDILVTGEYRLSEAPIQTHLTVSFHILAFHVIFAESKFDIYILFDVSPNTLCRVKIESKIYYLRNITNPSGFESRIMKFGKILKASD